MRREAERELERLATIPPASPEHGIIRTYLDWIAELPWDKLSGGEIDIARARQVLDEDHYDLEKIKDRILEYLAVRKLREERETARQEDEQVVPANVGVEVEGEGEIVPEPEPNVARETPVDRAAREPILLFVGPPGVGKTSLGQSIARSLGREFVRLSLGGVHDESEIRGHRRTYIGALPGRIIQALRRGETRDPVFMLDEIDKVGSDWRGDPSSALLEVLDPAQNHTFLDNYLGVPFDLSQVLFIATANTTDTIPAPLLDRMEVIPLSGYTDEEKVQIAQKYLVPKQVTAHGLTPEELLHRRRRAAPHRARLHPRGGRAQPGAADRHHRPQGRPRRRRGEERQRPGDARRTWSTTSAGRASSTRSPSARTAPAWPPVSPGRRPAATSSSSRRR